VRDHVSVISHSQHERLPASTQGLFFLFFDVRSRELKDLLGYLTVRVVRRAFLAACTCGRFRVSIRSLLRDAVNPSSSAKRTRLVGHLPCYPPRPMFETLTTAP